MSNPRNYWKSHDGYVKFSIAGQFQIIVIIACCTRKAFRQTGISLPRHSSHVLSGIHSLPSHPTFIIGHPSYIVV
jgi:hypothetical protein